MKKIMPYLLSLMIGSLFGFLIFRDTNFNIKDVFASTINATAFQLGVFNNVKSAEELKNKYDSAVIVKDEDVYRVYYSILSDDKVISKMETYLTEQNVNYYIKNITITDSNLIEALSEYENTMLKGSDTVLTSINSLIMSNYKGEQL